MIQKVLTEARDVLGVLAAGERGGDSRRGPRKPPQSGACRTCVASSGKKRGKMALRAEATQAEAGLTPAWPRPGHEAHLGVRPPDEPQCRAGGHGLT